MMFLSPKIISRSAVICSLAAPAAAQDICNGLGANGQWIGGSEAASDLTSADDYREQMALVLSGNQYVSLFSLSAPTTVRLEAAARGSGDPLIDVVGPDGGILLSDDDSGGNGAARAEIDLDPGTYCLALSSFDGAPMTAFVRIGRPEQEPLTQGIAATASVESNDISAPTSGGNCAAANDLGTLSGPISGTGAVENTPYWSFTLDAPTAISVTASNEDADPVLTLYDGGENFLDENDDFDGLNARIDVTDPLPAGDYCLQVNALDDTSLPVTIEVSEYDPEAAIQGLYNRGEAAPPLDGSYDITNLGTLETRRREDAQVTSDATWYSLDIDQGGLLLIEAIAPNEGDPWLALYDDLGRQIAVNDDYGPGLDALLTARVNSGTYLVAVKQVGGSTQGLIRMVFERYVPAP